MKHHLFSELVLMIPDLQQPFDIETDAFDYDIGIVLTHQGHIMDHCSETLSNVVPRYPIYEKYVYSIVHACQQWKNYILGKEMIIHIDHNPIQFMQTQGK
jgi:hypothetical protein